jgi:hypothetical protein
MKFTKNRLFLPIFGIIFGIVLVLGGNFYAVNLNGKAPLFLAIGGGIFGISLSKLLYLISNHFTARKHPQLHRAQNIELKDERNILVSEKAGAKTNILMLDLIFILTFVFAFMSIELWVTATMAGLMLTNITAHTIFARYFDKRL